MYSNSKVAKAVRLAMIVGATTAVSAPAYSFEEEAKAVERIEVTGSRIKRTDMETASPVAIISAEDLVAQGITRIDDVFRQMTSSQGAALGTNINNGGGGKATVNIRGLGANRTLVLVNGRRMSPSGIGANSTVDVNNIPVNFIERVEVLKDGASAAYGSDAIAGVVNVILKTDFEGIEFNGQYGQTTEDDGEEASFSITMGHSFDKGNFALDLTYYDKEEVRQADRDFSSCPIFEFIDLDGDGKLDRFCGGSSGVVGGRGNVGDTGNWTFLPGGQQLDPISGGIAAKPYSFFEDSYNYSELSYLETPQTRVQITGNGNYELTDNISAFVETMYTNRRSNQQMAPTRPNGLGPSAAGSYYNPTNPTGWFAEQGFFNDFNGDGVWDENDEADVSFTTRRMADLGPRVFEQSVSTYRVVAGLNGDVAIADTDVFWEVFYQFSRNDGTSYTHNQVNKDRFSDTMNEAVCTQDLASISNAKTTPVCANWFGIGNMSDERLAAAAEYVTYSEVDTGWNEQEIYGFNLSAEVFELPAGMIGVAAGAEHHREQGYNNPDILSQYGIGGGNASQRTAGGYDVDEFFLELAIPLLSDYDFAEQVDLSVAGRWFDYSTFGSDSTFNAGLTWRFNSNVMFRTKYTDNAFRAPTVAELFGGQGDDYQGWSDPCNSGGAGGPGSTQANCAADGLGSDFQQADGQIRAISGGNPDLGPETADILTVGAVLDFDGIVDGLSVTVDYYDIEIEGAVNQINANKKYADCYASANGGIGGSGPFCGDIGRLPNGQGDGPLSLLENSDVVETSGVDVNIAYNFQAWGADWNLTSDTSYVEKYDETDSEGNKLERVGTVTIDQGSFMEWKSNFGANVSADDWAINYSLRWLDGVEDEFLANGVENPDDYAEPGHLNIGSVVYHDISGQYFINDNATVQLGVNNVGDKQAPYHVNYNDSNTDIYTYDLIGRRWYVKFTYKL